MAQHSKNLSTTYGKKRYYISDNESTSKEIEIDWSPIIAEQSNSKGKNKSPGSTLSFITTTAPESSFSVDKKKVIANKKEKGKRKQQNTLQDCQESNTTEKLIELITQISSRLNHIEENMGISYPNRS